MAPCPPGAYDRGVETEIKLRILNLSLESIERELRAAPRVTVREALKISAEAAAICRLLRVHHAQGS